MLTPHDKVALIWRRFSSGWPNSGTYSARKQCIYRGTRRKCCLLSVGFVVVVVLVMSATLQAPLRVALYLEEITSSALPVDSYSLARCVNKGLRAGWSSAIWDGVNMDKLRTLSERIQNSGRRDTNPSPSRSTAFLPALNVTYRELMYDLLVVFVEMARRQNLTYFLYGGSLIGSFRHHGLIPWDDDVDVAVFDEHSDRLKAIFAELPKPYKGVVHADRWKLTYDNRPVIRQQLDWSFPFVDISFFVVTKDYVRDKDWTWTKLGFQYKTSDVFPLTLRPFWDLWLPVPRKTEAVLGSTYDIDLCVTSSYCHSCEKPIHEAYNAPCRSLRQFYPFVERTEVNSTATFERLVVDGQVVQGVTITDVNGTCN